MYRYADLVRVLAYCPSCNSTGNKPEVFLILLVCLLSPDVLNTVREWLTWTNHDFKGFCEGGIALALLHPEGERSSIASPSRNSCRCTGTDRIALPFCRTLPAMPRGRSWWLGTPGSPYYPPRPASGKPGAAIVSQDGGKPTNERKIDDHQSDQQ